MSIETPPKAEKSPLTPEQEAGSYVIPPNRFRFDPDQGKIIEVSPEERRDIAERNQERLEAAPEAPAEIPIPAPAEQMSEMPEAGNEVIRMTQEQVAQAFSERIKERVKEARNFEELYQILKDAEQIGASFEAGKVFKAADWQNRIESLVQKVRSGQDISENDIVSITRQGGLRRRVEDLLRIEMVKLLLEQAG